MDETTVLVPADLFDQLLEYLTNLEAGGARDCTQLRKELEADSYEVPGITDELASAFNVELANLREYLRRDRFQHGGEQRCSCSSCMAADRFTTGVGHALNVHAEA